MKTKIFFTLLCVTGLTLTSCEKNELNFAGYRNGHKYVDLGLSVKWATMNVGAIHEEDYGNYYAWGEITPKEEYTWSTYQYADSAYYKITKYCSDSLYGKSKDKDNKIVLEPMDDVAYKTWKGTWRIPTESEWTELQEKCKWTWIKTNGISGYKVTAKNGNFIFLPAAGCRQDSSCSYDNLYGNYWSSSLFKKSPDKAWYLRFDSVNGHWNSNAFERYFGRSIRPVF